MQTFRYPIAPRLAAPTSVPAMMLDVIVALIPALGMSVYLFGTYVLLVALCSMGFCVLFQWLYCVALVRRKTFLDPSPWVTGLLLAFCYPPEIPLWGVALGSFFSIIVVKEIFGGFGCNFLNPALAGRMAIATIPFLMCYFTQPLPMVEANLLDATSSATPLAYLALGELPPLSLDEMALGFHSGSLGEVSTLMLGLGGVYLLIRRVISPVIPFSFLGTVAILTYCFPLGNPPLHWMLAHISSGGLVLAAFFMATDPVTSPLSLRSQWCFGFGCGLLTVLLRYFGSYPEGVGFAVLTMNGLVWLLDALGSPRPFGTKPLALLRKKINVSKNRLTGLEFAKPSLTKITTYCKNHYKAVVKLWENRKNKVMKLKTTAKPSEKGQTSLADEISAEEIHPDTKTEQKKATVRNSAPGEEYLDLITKIPQATKAFVSYILILSVTIFLISWCNNKSQLARYRATEAKNQELLAVAMPSAELMSETPYSSELFHKLYFAYSGQQQEGYCVEVVKAGFVGELHFLVGVDLNGAVTGVAVVAQDETPRIGTNALTFETLQRFIGKSGTISLGGSNAVDGVSGATVTLSAVVEAVNQALYVVQLIDQVDGLEEMANIL